MSFCKKHPVISTVSHWIPVLTRAEFKKGFTKSINAEKLHLINLNLPVNRFFYATLIITSRINHSISHFFAPKIYGDAADFSVAILAAEQEQIYL
jgi:hypothetical protein